MVSYTEVYFHVENMSNKDLILFGSYRLRPGARTDLFRSIPSLSETRILDALRSPSGELYVFSIQKKIVIHGFRLATLDNVIIDVGHVGTSNAPERGKVLGFDGTGLKWVSGGGGHVDVDAPLARDGDVLRLDRAGPHTSGYLSKEDWLMFSNITTGFRIWQHCDLGLDSGVKCKITSFSNLEIPFNAGSIINGSAVIVKSYDNTAPGRTFWSKLSGDAGVCVVQHIGDEILLNRAPGASEECRAYFLVSLPAGLEVPPEYGGAPDYVRKMRAEYFDFIDLNSSKTELIKGKKIFKSDASFESNQSIGGDLAVSGGVAAHSITIKNSPQANYSLTSSAMGSGSWQPNPLVSDGPPLNCYNGQLWVKAPSYDLYVYDGVRECWLGAAERSVSAWSSQLLSHSYLAPHGGSTCDVVPYKATLVGLVTSSERGPVWTAEVHVNGAAVAGAVVSCGEDGRGFRFDLNVAFNAGDRLQFFANGHMVDKPKIEAIFRRSL